MLYHQLKRFLIERDIWIGLLIFGICAMLADLLGDLGRRDLAAIVRFFGLFLLIALLISDFILRKKRQPFAVPIMFTEITDRQKSRNMFNSYIQAAKLSRSANILEKLTQVKVYDLIIRLDRRNPRGSHDPQDWIDAWVELLREWQEIDRESIEEPLTTEGRCYHIFPNIILPLAFALGASVNFRRSLVLYHIQDEQYYNVLNLHNPREIIQEGDSAVKPPEVVNINLDTLPKKNKLILHIIISARHPENFEAHIDYQNAANIAIAYRFDPDPATNWIPYVKQIFQQAKPLLAQYREVEICLICPSVIAFTLGMAFSRTPNLTVCHWFGSSQEYQPVFPLSQIEHQLPFS